MKKEKKTNEEIKERNQKGEKSTRINNEKNKGVR